MKLDGPDVIAALRVPIGPRRGIARPRPIGQDLHEEFSIVRLVERRVHAGIAEAESLRCSGVLLVPTRRRLRRGTREAPTFSRPSTADPDRLRGEEDWRPRARRRSSVSLSIPTRSFTPA